MTDLLPYLLPITISALTGFFSFYLYYRVRRLGFAVIGASFLIGTIPNLVNLAFGAPDLLQALRDRGWDVQAISAFSSLLSLLQMIVTLISTVLILIGLVLLSRSSHKA